MNTMLCFNWQDIKRLTRNVFEIDPDHYLDMKTIRIPNRYTFH